jgi:hypothetical protein
MTTPKQTTPAHLTAIATQAGLPSTKITLAPASPVTPASLGIVGDARAFADAHGQVLAAWPDGPTALDWLDFAAAWEFAPYIQNQFNWITINPAGLWFNRVKQIAPISSATYLAKYGALMTP